MTDEKTNKGRSDEARDPSRTGGVGPREDKGVPGPEDQPRPDQTLPGEGILREDVPSEVTEPDGS